ncbi:MAG TPA: cobalt ABC transporter ATP-binding protein [Candidatus Omnitrophica bacterium]|nr:cobalt ABC transporter ATP-binding protein [Candidatus Omnitrophota bacterium]
MSKAIEFEHVAFSYPDGTNALEDINFSVDSGECLGLIGPNGAGKTTLLLHLNGILRGSGSIRVHGSQLCDENITLIRKDVGMVFQDPDMQLFMPTVFEDVSFGPLHMGLPDKEIKERVFKALNDVDMAYVSDKISHHLSFGEKRRVSIATVLSMEPKILVLDEPTSNLDPKHRSQLIDILRSIPVTKIIASHDLDMISRLADRVLFLEEGRAAAIGQTKHILSNSRLFKELGFYL